jgi:hypothetical protein
MRNPRSRVPFIKELVSLLWRVTRKRLKGQAVHSDRKYVAHYKRRGRADPREAVGNAQRPRPG